MDYKQLFSYLQHARNTAYQIRLEPMTPATMMERLQKVDTMITEAIDLILAHQEASQPNNIQPNGSGE